MQGASTNAGGQGRGRSARLLRPVGASLAGLAAVVLMTTGCSSSSSPKAVASAAGAKATASAASGSGDMRAYSACMRQHGVAAFPDPDAQGHLNIDGNKVDMNSPQVQSALNACKQYLPSGGSGPSLGGPAAPEAAQAALAYAKCMRTHGIPKFPDPNAQGGLNIDGSTLGVDPNGPAFQAADKTCQPLLQKGATGPKTVQSGAPGQ